MEMCDTVAPRQKGLQVQRSCKGENSLWISKKYLGGFWARMKQRSEVARDLVIQSLVDLGTNTGFEKVGVILNKGEGRKERSRPQI